MSNPTEFKRERLALGDGVVLGRTQNRKDVADSPVLSWRGLESKNVCRVTEDFLQAASGTLVAPWATQDTSAAGTPTLDFVNDADNGHYVLQLATDNEVEAISLYFGDQLVIDVTSRPVVEFRLKVEADPTGGGGALAAGDIIVFGLASARNATLDNVAEHAWFRFEGANNNVLVETDDGTTDDDDNDTGSDWTDDTFAVYKIDLNDLSDVRFYVDGTLVGSGYDLSAASGNLQPFIEVTKAAAANFDHKMTIDYVDVAWLR